MSTTWKGPGGGRAAPRDLRVNKAIASFFILLFAIPAIARSFLTQEEALNLAFPAASAVERESLYLSDAERENAVRLAGVEFTDELVVRYVAKQGGKVTGFAYFDAHRVRTLPETIMIVVGTDNRIARVEILSFSEPLDYLPKERWLDQLDGKALDDELSLTRAIRPISGATLSGRAIVNASRKMLAIHEVVAARGRKK